MKVKEICLCLFAVSDALLGFLIRMAKPSRVGTMYTYTWLLLLSLVLSLCKMDAMKPEVKEGTWKGKNRTCIPLANRVSRTHMPAAMTGRQRIFFWGDAGMLFLARYLGKWKMKSQLCDTNQKGRSNFLESIPVEKSS